MNLHGKVKCLEVIISRRAVGPGIGDIATPLSVRLCISPSRLVFAL